MRTLENILFFYFTYLSILVSLCVRVCVIVEIDIDIEWRTMEDKCIDLICASMYGTAYNKKIFWLFF